MTYILRSRRGRNKSAAWFTEEAGFLEHLGCHRLLATDVGELGGV